MPYTYQNLECKIDPAAEREAILRFLGKYWNVRVKKGSLEEAVGYILQQGVEYGIALQEKETEEYIGMHNTWVEMINSQKKNEALKPIEFKKTGTETEFSFERNTEGLKEYLCENYDISAEPKDYAAFKKQHKSDDFADIDEELEFEGMPLHKSLRGSCPNFQETLKKGQIYYSDAEQGRSPLTEMAGAIFRQGMSLGMSCVDEKYGTHRGIMDKIHELNKAFDNLKF